jgi:predicted nucleotidyltransferase component of viral defense system
MISRDEISLKAKELDIHAANVQRDYVFGWLLKTISEDPYLGKLLVLKGGNCFRKVYFPNTRFSEDLDFSTSTSLDISRLQASLASCCAAIQADTAVVFDSERNSVKEDRVIGVGGEHRQTIYKARVYFSDFFGNRSDLQIAVRLDITEFDRIYLPTQQRPIVHPYSDANSCVGSIQCLALEEMIASKMKCLLQRRHSHDFFDMAYTYVLRNEAQINRSEVMAVFLKKTIFATSPGSAKDILLGLPIDFFRSAWERYIVCPIASRFSFDVATANFREFLEELFAGTSPCYGASLAFFPAELRNPIMDAARERRLLRVTYDGTDRLVEPYALMYKRRQDRVAQEYFYCWDATGGRTSPPGVKTLLNGKMSRAELTDQPFEPRFEIELSKAGERAKVDYFGSGKTRVPAPRRARSTPSRNGAMSLVYVVQCPYCQKRFRRAANDTALKAHKTPDGWPCSARRGYIVETKYR